jgi:hypothetical protein
LYEWHFTGILVLVLEIKHISEIIDTITEWRITRIPEMLAFFILKEIGLLYSAFWCTTKRHMNSPVSLK